MKILFLVVLLSSTLWKSCAQVVTSNVTLCPNFDQKIKVNVHIDPFNLFERARLDVNISVPNGVTIYNDACLRLQHFEIGGMVKLGPIHIKKEIEVTGKKLEDLQFEHNNICEASAFRATFGQCPISGPKQAVFTESFDLGLDHAHLLHTLVKMFCSLGECHVVAQFIIRNGIQGISDNKICNRVDGNGLDLACSDVLLELR